MRVLIVDDEYLIRHGLATAIDWNALGFHSVVTAEDCIEALASIELDTPDLILTDIRMPFMTGLEFAERVKTSVPDICIVIISGHDEFVYAQSAVKLAIFDYVLKPINLKEISAVIIRARTWIEQKRERQESKYFEQIFTQVVDVSSSELYQQALLDEDPDALDFYDIKAFTDILRSGSQKQILTAFEQVQNGFSNHSNVSRILLQLVCGNIFIAGKHAIEELGGELEAIFDDPIREFCSIVNQPTTELMFSQLQPTILSMLEYRSALVENQYVNEIATAKKFMLQNYHDMNMSLQSVAKHVNMSPTYFCAMFKQVTGQGFINYLTSLRVQKAKELLQSTNLKSCEICFKVGYDTPSYFSTVFKKITGDSPSDYKKKQQC